MNFKKFISGVGAFAIAASAFAGMAITANATDIDDVEVPSGETSIFVQNVPILLDVSSIDYRIIYESDVYVADGGYVELDYIGGYKGAAINGIGPKFRLNAEAADGVVKVQKDDNNNFLNIVDGDYGEYFAGHTVHVRIVTPISSANRIGNSTITLSAYDGDNDAFHKDKSNRPRYPHNDISGGRTISGRNLGNNRTFSGIDITVRGDANIKNASINLDKIAATENGLNVFESDDDSGASVWTATVTNDTAYELKNITVTATGVLGEENKTGVGSVETSIAAGSQIQVATIVDEANVDSVSNVSIRIH